MAKIQQKIKNKVIMSLKTVTSAIRARGAG